MTAVCSLALFSMLSSCKQKNVEVLGSTEKSYVESSCQFFEESEFSQWMSKADQQIAYEGRDENTYFAYTEGRSKNGFLQFRHVVQPLPCLLYTSPSPRDKRQSRMPSSA